MVVRTVLMILMMQVLLWGGAGDLDSTFGGDGKVTTAIGSDRDEAYGVAIQSDGKIVAVGRSEVASGSDFTLVRYNSNGTLDATFDDDGIVITQIGGFWDIAKSVVIQSDGKIVVAGTSYSGSYNQFAVVRYDTNGSLDNTFGSEGKVTTGIGFGDYAESIAIQNDGKIVVAGYSQFGNMDFSVVRYDTNGSLDGTFGGDGKVTTPVGNSSDKAYGVAIQSDGKIVVAGERESSGYTDLAVVRYDTNGSLDNTFDGDGKVTTDAGSNKDSAQSVAIQSDGKIIVAGIGSDSSNEDFAVVRYDMDGSPDSTFGSDGIVITDIDGSRDRAYGVAIQNNKKIVVAGSGISGQRLFAAVRYDTDGSLDNTFGSEGKVTTALGNIADDAFSTAIQSDGKIVVAGTSYNGDNWDFAVVRYIGDPVITLAPIYYLLQ